MNMNIFARKDQELIVEHNLDIGRFLFYPNVLVSEFAEGIHATLESVAEPVRLAQEIYSDKVPVVYISHRLNSYSMDPVSYVHLVNMFPNLVGFAIVSQNKYRRMLASLEKLFVRRPVSVFFTLEESFSWAEDLLEKKISKKQLH